ncbi:MAG: hypothetical protein WBD40_14675 [Tepidisphaeraceae bacterium]
MKPLVTSTLVFLVVGCARYEFDIVAPPDLAAHIGARSDAVTNLDPLVYQWRAVDNRLVVRIFNPTNDPIELVGEKSTVVSPDGQSHPVMGQTIAPQSYAKLILPPMRPSRAYDPWGPSYSGGAGIEVDGRRRAGYPVHEPYAGQPRYLTVYDADAYWDWKGETDVRLILVYQRGDQPLRHDFTIHRRKM